ncbi:MAG: hypothetical protein ACOC1K_07280 [Nanoarchaeota archaeon]
MKLKVKEFKDFLKKGTLNFSIDSFSCTIGEKINSRMITKSNDAISILNFDNNIFSGFDDQISLNFSDPASNIIPFLSLIEEDQIDFSISDQKIMLKNGKQRSNIHFCDEEIPSKFGPEKPKISIKPFISIDVNSDLLEAIQGVKKIGSRFGKVYFSVEDGIFYIETTDKTNKFSNGLKFELSPIETSNKNLQFNYSNFINLFSILDKDKEYKMNFFWIEEKDAGMCQVYSTDDTENYYIMSKMDI